MKNILGEILGGILATGIVVLGMISNSPAVMAGDFAFGDDASVEATEEIAVGGTQDGLATDDPLIEDIQGMVNWVLGVAGLIVLIMLIYGGFLMVTAAGSERYATGFNILKQAAIGLLIIGVAWFIASLGFWLAQELGEAGPAGTDG